MHRCDICIKGPPERQNLKAEAIIFLQVVATHCVSTSAISYCLCFFVFCHLILTLRSLFILSGAEKFCRHLLWWRWRETWWEAKHKGFSQQNKRTGTYSAQCPLFPYLPLSPSLPLSSSYTWACPMKNSQRRPLESMSTKGHDKETYKFSFNLNELLVTNFWDLSCTANRVAWRYIVFVIWIALEEPSSKCFLNNM